jgi:hypothetical protein
VGEIRPRPCVIGVLRDGVRKQEGKKAKVQGGVFFTPPFFLSIAGLAKSR